MIEKGWFSRIRKVLELEEGNRRFAYDDATGKSVAAPEGHLTIGIGHNLQLNGLSDAARELILREDVEIALDDACRVFGEEKFMSFPEQCRTAIISLLFQLGYTKFIQFSPTIELMENERWEEAAARLENTKWADQLRAFGSKRLDRTLTMLRECRYEKDYGIDSLDSPSGNSSSSGSKHWTEP